VRAELHVKQVRDFFYHLMVYVFVGVLLIILDLGAGASVSTVLGLDWAYWLLLFWGLGLAGHGISVFLGGRRVDRVADEYRSRKAVRH
jgi:hypothetical protein